MDAETHNDVRSLFLLLGSAIEDSCDSPVEVAEQWEVARRALKAVAVGHVSIDSKVEAELDDYLRHARRSGYVLEEDPGPLAKVLPLEAGHRRR